MIAKWHVVYALFGSLAWLKIIPLVAPAILSTFFSIDSYHALKLSLNHRDQTEVSSLKNFLKILTLSNISVITQRLILSAIDLFVFILVISFTARTFLPSARFFHIPYRSRNY